MRGKFEVGNKYAGENIYGGCGCLDTRCMVVLKREGDTVVYEERFGKALIRTTETQIKTIDEWGEYVTTGDDRFFAYAEYK